MCDCQGGAYESVTLALRLYQEESTKCEDHNQQVKFTYLTFANEAGRVNVMAPPNRAWDRTPVGMVGRFLERK